MSEITFDAADLLPDIPPVDLPEHGCDVCGADVQYSGRGRIPKKCPEHKRGGAKENETTPTRAGVKTTAKNDALAKQAAAALTQVNGLLATCLMLAPGGYSLPMTASALAAANDGFSEAAYNALVTDPKLAALILKGGGASGKVALLMAYGMLAGAVVPVAVAEFKEEQNGAAAE